MRAAKLPGFVGTLCTMALAFTILLHACRYVPTTLVGGPPLFKVDWGYKRGRGAGATRQRSRHAAEYHRADA